MYRPCINSQGDWPLFYNIKYLKNGTRWSYTCSGFIFSSFFIHIFCWIPCNRLKWLPISFWLHVKYTVSSSYRTDLPFQPHQQPCEVPHILTVKQRAARLPSAVQLDFPTTSSDCSICIFSVTDFQTWFKPTTIYQDQAHDQDLFIQQTPMTSASMLG